MFEVRRRAVPEQVAVVERRAVDQAQLEEWLPGAMARVWAQAQQHRPLDTRAWPYLERGSLAPEPVFVVVYRGDPHEGPAEVEVCSPVAPDSPGDGLAVVPARSEAFVRVTRRTVDDGRLGEVYATLQRWAAGSGLELDGPPCETYWTDFNAARPDDEVFDVGWGVR
ncbi:hypothetical protein CLV35_1087 [Motilibacter peucedani]|uniref:Effector-binding domain-containing protein n=1 Tax=Motilibacter peucedani TaxID=598650 RepID=A0A420XRG7_9ACTN|nr:GyrI-like domain-containing protein [Motilibacter peucedani]RKS77401.1 hypothetical protein CLV35_1087 [Motilibacter peucedani]